MENLPIDPSVLTIGGLGLIPTIIFILQILKSYFPDNTPSKVWSTLALGAGVGGVFLAQYGAGGIPSDPIAIFVLVVVGLAAGKLASAGYDQTLRGTVKETPVKEPLKIHTPLTPADAAKVRQAFLDLENGLLSGGKLNATADLAPWGWSIDGEHSFHNLGRPEVVIVGDDGREYALSVNTSGQLVAVPLPYEGEEQERDPEKAKAYFESIGATVQDKTEPLERGNPTLGTSDFSEG